MVRLAVILFAAGPQGPPGGRHQGNRAEECVRPQQGGESALPLFR